jgi:drug/metabolite transporter (DMT)-like permease
VLQYRATHQVPTRAAGRPILLVDLIRRPGWRWSIVLALLGFGCQVLALRLVPLILVQPLLVTGVLWYVVLSARLRHRRPDRGLVLTTLLCLAGLSAFLVVAEPSAGRDRGGLDDLWSALPLAIGLSVALAVCLVLAAVVRRWRALPLALASGVCYGVTAGFVRSLSSHFGEGVVGVAGHWQTWAIVVLGPLGVLLSQNAYQAGPVGAPALTVITVTDPLVSIAVGLLWLGESIEVGPARVAGEAIALAALTAGIAMLARRAPHVAAQLPPGAGSAVPASRAGSPSPAG